MLIANQRLIEIVIETLARLQQRPEMSSDVVYDLNAGETLLRHVLHTNLSDGEELREYCRGLITLVESILSGAVASDREIREAAARILTLASDLSASKSHAEALRPAFEDLIAQLDELMTRIAVARPEEAKQCFRDMSDHLLRQHNRLPLFGDHTVAPEAQVPHGDTLTAQNLTAYFRHRLHDDGAIASDVATLPGGFGKETTLFRLASKELSGEFVVRRDPPINIFGDLDCHVAQREYVLLRAVHARGFPAPEPVMFEEGSSDIIAGPAFTVMRRASGRVVGDVGGGTGKISRHLQKTLAQVTARLHAEPPLTELGHIPAFDPSHWKKSAGECARDYIDACYRHFLHVEHLPIPVLHGLFNWLLGHVPDNDEPTVLVHGDIGFHNLILDGDHLSAMLDWEYSHIGGAAEDIGYIRCTMGNQLDWEFFLDEYEKAGGKIPDEKHIRYFEIWSLVRNTAGAVTVAAPFSAGRYLHIKFGMTIYRYVPYFITQAATLIRRYND